MSDDEELTNFEDLGLDDRLLKSIGKLGWKKVTAIQEASIPLILNGKDVLLKGQTGSGKTGAFCLPLIQKLLVEKKTTTVPTIRALILTPSKELCKQATKCIKDLIKSCSRIIRVVDVSEQTPLPAQRALLVDKPDVVVATPSRIMAHVKAGNMKLDDIVLVVIDEADLLFSFGYEAEIRFIEAGLANACQRILVSATLGDDLITLKKLMLHSPAVVKLTESSLPDASQLTQYHIRTSEEDKFLLIYALPKLHLLRGRTLVFVATVDRAYRLKLYLHAFGLSAAVLNCQMPAASRCHIVDQFNEGVYPMIIATDEQSLHEPMVESASKTKDKRPTEASKRKKPKIAEASVSRGVDFQSVANVINFDFPPSVDAYVHRVGRTARAGHKVLLVYSNSGKVLRSQAKSEPWSGVQLRLHQGTALSFVAEADLPLLSLIESQLGGGEGGYFQPYNFKMDEIEGFRYRARDALRAITRLAVREARLAEIRVEIVKSDRLKAYFDEHPADLAALRHDEPMKMGPKLPQTLKHVPDYIIPPSLRSYHHSTSTGGRPSKQPRHRRRIVPHDVATAKRTAVKRKADPLQSFTVQPMTKKKKKGGGGKVA